MNIILQQLLIIYGMLFIEALIVAYAMYRNDRVYSYRLECLHSDYGKYNRLPSYEYMNNIKWWVWDFDSFLSD